MEEFKFSTIEEAVADLRAGKMIIAVDDPDRENEGDLICAAEFATLENVNFMASYAKGLICMPMSKALTTKLGLEQMVATNTDNHCTAFTVSIDHVDTTTGISALERSVTAMKAVEDNAKPEGFPSSGTYVPVGGKEGGRAGAYGTHGGHGGLDANCRVERVWLMLRDYARGWNDDAYTGVEGVC